MRRAARIFLRLLVALAFAWGGLSKLESFRTTQPDGQAFRTRHATVVDDMTRGDKRLLFLLIFFELLLAGWLISTKAERAALVLAVAMLSLFTGLLAAEVVKSEPRPCGCDGYSAAAQSSKSIRVGLIVSMTRNGVIMLAAALAFINAPSASVSKSGERRSVLEKE